MLNTLLRGPRRKINLLSTYLRQTHFLVTPILKTYLILWWKRYVVYGSDFNVLTKHNMRWQNIVGSWYIVINTKYLCCEEYRSYFVKMSLSLNPNPRCSFIAPKWVFFKTTALVLCVCSCKKYGKYVELFR